MADSYFQILSGDEPLLMMEACDVINASAKQQGVSEREIVDVSDKFNWDQLLAESASLSLFATSKLTEIRFNKPPAKDAQTALQELAQRVDADNRLLLRLPKLEKRQKSTKWFKTLSQTASLQELWPPKPADYARWINQRASQAGVELEAEASQMLAELTEGNLLAASQSLDKLALLYPQEKITLTKLASVTSDNARYSIFLCLDEALGGFGERAVKMLQKFRQEGLAPIAILVNLTREIDLCKNTAIAVQRGQSAHSALANSYIWDSKKRLIIAAAGRLPAGLWQKLMIRTAFMDRLVKGQEKGDIWREMESCLWMISGTRIWGAK